MAKQLMYDLEDLFKNTSHRLEISNRNGHLKIFVYPEQEEYEVWEDVCPEDFLVVDHDGMETGLSKRGVLDFFKSRYLDED